MNTKFDELTTSLAQSVTRRAALKKFGVGLAWLAVIGMLTLPSAATNPSVGTSVASDPAGDTVLPDDFFDGPVPAYLDMVEASVSSNRGVFHFEVKMAAQVPADADPGLTPSVNHLGPVFGILTGPKNQGQQFTFFGQKDSYRFNFLVGALYSASDSGIGLDLGWSGFLLDLSTSTVVEIPVQIRGDTLVFETTAASLGNPGSFEWLVGAECHPVPVPLEKNKTTLIADFLPDHGYVTWSAQ